MAPLTDRSLHAHIKSRYNEIRLMDISSRHTMLAMFYTWILLAGFVVLPGSFKTIENLPIDNTILKKVVSTIQNIPLLVVGLICCAIGGIGMCYLWWLQRAAYIWLVDSIFLPGWLSGVAGLISTFVCIYTHNKGVFGASMIACVAVTGATTVICGFLAAFYSFWLLRRLKNEHDQLQKEIGSEAGTENGTEK